MARRGVIAALLVIMAVLPLLVLRLHGTEIERPLAVVMIGGNLAKAMRTPGRGLRHTGLSLVKVSLPNILEPIDPPSRQRRFAISKRATWRTWSSEFRRFIGEWSRYARRASRPTMKLIGRIRPYGETYTHRVDERSELAPALSAFTRALMLDVDLGTLCFLDGLLTDGLSRKSVHLLFAAMRETAVSVLGDSRAALYNPLGSFGKNSGDFPLHADLYAPRFLFNIFDDVPADGSGASIFLSVDELRQVLPTVTSMPRAVRTQILNCQRRVIVTDRYDEFFDLLHSSRHPWHRELRTALRRAQHVIPFTRGQGYLIDDRLWLHGRETPARGVTQNRIHRLIFDSRRTAAARGRALKTS
jgi:hypothetical protein